MATVAVPPTRATLPKLFAPAAVVVPTFALKILLPEVTKLRFPVMLVLETRLMFPVEPAVKVMIFAACEALPTENVCVPALLEPVMIETVWLAPGVAPFKMLIVDAPVADAALKILNVFL